MDRRTALQRLGLLAGASISASTMSALMAGCHASPAMDYVPRAFFEAQFRYIGMVADIILPPSETPGAFDVGVQVFMDTLLADYVLESERSEIISGIDAMMASSPHMTVDQATALDLRAFSDPFPDDPEARTWRRLKEWTVVGYYTSAEGASAELDLMPFGPFKADMDTKRTWA